MKSQVHQRFVSTGVFNGIHRCRSSGFAAGIARARHRESDYSLSGVPATRRFNAKEILKTPYVTDKFQEKYFVIDSFERLYLSLDEIDAQITGTADNEKNRRGKERAMANARAH